MPIAAAAAKIGDDAASAVEQRVLGWCRSHEGASIAKKCEAAKLIIDGYVQGYVEGFVFDGFPGVVIDSPNLAAMSVPAITMDGAMYVGENSRMRKAADFAGHAFDVALSAAVQAAASRI